MRYFPLLLLIFLIVGCKGMSASNEFSVGRLDSATYNFDGLWRGTLVLTDLTTNGKTNCPSEVKISQLPGTYIINYGTFNCGGQVENWPQTVLTVSNGKLYLGNQEVGKVMTERLTFTYVTNEAILMVNVFPLTLTDIQLRVVYLDSSSAEPYARLEGTLTRQ